MKQHSTKFVDEKDQTVLRLSWNDLRKISNSVLNDDHTERNPIPAWVEQKEVVNIDVDDDNDANANDDVKVKIKVEVNNDDNDQSPQQPNIADSGDEIDKIFESTDSGNSNNEDKNQKKEMKKIKKEQKKENKEGSEEKKGKVYNGIQYDVIGFEILPEYREVVLVSLPYIFIYAYRAKVINDYI